MEILSWNWVAIILMVLVLIAGFVTGRNLSEPRKTEHIRKFALLSFVPMILVFLFSTPFVYNRSSTESLKYIDLDKLDSGSVRSDQAELVNELKTEVEALRKDLADANDYYRRLSDAALTVALVICFAYPFRRNEEDGQDVEKYPLGLNNNDE